jgi:predicted CXXCH cytochrome family protein
VNPSRALGAAGSLVVVALAATLAGARPHGADVHRPDADCAVCHTADVTALRAEPAGAAGHVVPDLETRCYECHGDEGPSHRTGMPAGKRTSASLPLSPDGLIVCATCHFMHGEQNPYGDFVRLDNRRGGLCLTCHDLSELQ